MNLRVVVIPVTLYQQNCSLLICTETNKAALVDPGGDVDKLYSAVKKEGVVIEKVLLTHGHLDHCSAARDVADHFQVEIEGPHKADQFWIDQLPMQCAQAGFPAVSVFHPDRYLEESDQVTVGNLTLDVYHCPGHTPGHVVFHSKLNRLAWVGDVIFKGSIGRTDFPQSNHQALIDSIREKLFKLDDATQFIPGHGPTSTFGAERATNPFVADARYR